MSQTTSKAILPTDNGEERVLRRRHSSCKLTRAVIAEVAKLLPICMYVETVAATLGIHRDTFYEWRRRGKVAAEMRIRDEIIPHRERLYLQFSDAVEKALADGEVRDLATITKASRDTDRRPGQWTAAAWRLERRFPDRWGRRDRMEISGPGGGPIQTMQAQIDVARMIMEDPTKAPMVRDAIEEAFAKLPPAAAETE